jgi:hypothetical protein
MNDLDDPLAVEFANQLEEIENRRIFGTLWALYRQHRLKLNKRKRQKRARTGRR